MKFFLIDFNGNIFIEDISKLKDIYFSFPALTLNAPKTPKKKLILKKEPISFERYQKAFSEVIREIEKGNTYLLNLTFPTKIKTNYTLCSISTITQKQNSNFYSKTNSSVSHPRGS